VETALYLVAREALHNASRYSNAGHVWIRLAYRAGSSGPGAVSLQVHDDGRGFVADGVDREGHFGLTMMGEQAALAGGELSLDSSAGGGTRIEVVVPLAGDRPEVDGESPDENDRPADERGEQTGERGEQTDDVGRTSSESGERPGEKVERP
jgi:signal transduction histidine kinase